MKYTPRQTSSCETYFGIKAHLKTIGKFKKSTLGFIKPNTSYIFEFNDVKRITILTRFLFKHKFYRWFQNTSNDMCICEKRIQITKTLLHCHIKILNYLALSWSYKRPLRKKISRLVILILLFQAIIQKKIIYIYFLNIF